MNATSKVVRYHVVTVNLTEDDYVQLTNDIGRGDNTPSGQLAQIVVDEIEYAIDKAGR